MGFNSVVMICNDCIGAIEDDPKGWWEKTWRALNNILGHSLSYEEAREEERKGGRRTALDLTGSYGHGCNANGYQAVWNCHASSTGLIAVGGNHATVLLQEYEVPHHSHEGQVKLLKALAKKLGYRVVKKPDSKEGDA